MSSVAAFALATSRRSATPPAATKSVGLIPRTVCSATGNETDADVLVGRGTLGRGARRGRLELRRRLLERRAVGEARQNRVVVADVVRPLASVHVRRDPEVAVLANRSWQGGARRHHADHGVWLVVHLNDAAQDVGIAAVPPSPQTVAEDHGRRRVGRCLQSAVKPRPILGTRPSIGMTDAVTALPRTRSGLSSPVSEEAPFATRPIAEKARSDCQSA